VPRTAFIGYLIALAKGCCAVLRLRRERRVALLSAFFAPKAFYHLSRRLNSYKAILHFEYTSPTRIAVT
jgi:hypothetical protein